VLVQEAEELEQLSVRTADRLSYGTIGVPASYSAATAPAQAELRRERQNLKRATWTL
jgi:hypothetical protein